MKKFTKRKSNGEVSKLIRKQDNYEARKAIKYEIVWKKITLRKMNKTREPRRIADKRGAVSRMNKNAHHRLFVLKLAAIHSNKLKQISVALTTHLHTYSTQT